MSTTVLHTHAAHCCLIGWRAFMTVLPEMYHSPFDHPTFPPNLEDKGPWSFYRRTGMVRIPLPLSSGSDKSRHNFASSSLSAFGWETVGQMVQSSASLPFFLVFEPGFLEPGSLQPFRREHKKMPETWNYTESEIKICNGVNGETYKCCQTCMYI